VDLCTGGLVVGTSAHAVYPAAASSEPGVAVTNTLPAQGASDARRGLLGSEDQDSKIMATV